MKTMLDDPERELVIGNKMGSSDAGEIKTGTNVLRVDGI